MMKGRYLAWREGRPRWTPGPALRALGAISQDLKDAGGNWLEFEQANIEAERLTLEAKARFDFKERRRSAASEQPLSTRRFQRKIREGTLDQYREAHASGFVYFLWTADTVKVGFSTNPFRRLTALETTVSGKIARVGIVPGSRYDEQRLHRRFIANHSHGEWFKITAVMDDILFSILRHGSADLDNSEQI